MSKQAKIILFCCLYILGIIVYFSNILIIGTLAVFLCFFILFHKNIITFKHIIFLILIFIIGILNSAYNTQKGDDLSSYYDENCEITAKVLTIPSNSKSDKTSFYAKVFKVKSDNENLKDIKAKSYITLNDKEGNFKNIKIGDTLLIKGKIKQPLNAQNPSQFDYYKYLSHKKTFSLIYSDKWEIKARASDLNGKLLRKLNDVRTNIINIHSHNIQSPMLEILGGIIFGDDAVNPDEETKNKFINSGIFHILAASGMNVTLIFGIWFFFAKSLNLNYRFSILSGMALIIFYTCMTGFGPPIIRASLMLILILLGKLIDRKTSTITLLFLVAFLMLLYNPLMIFDIGFQLSFTVTFGLILTSPLVVFKFKFKPLNYILGACIIPVIAQIYAAPFQLFYFNTFSIYSVLSNIAIIPVLSIVSFLGFISSILSLINSISYKVCYYADLILNPLLIYITKVAGFFSNLPNAIIYLKKPALLQIILYFAIIIFITLIVNYKLYFKKIFITLSLIILCFLLSFISIPSKEFEILFFSVGNADAIMLKSMDNEYFMIDTGKFNYYSTNTQAKNIIIKYMRDKGIKKLNSLIVTHFDADHAGGSEDIINNLKVENIYITDIYENTQLSQRILENLKNKKYFVIKDEKIIYNKNNLKIKIIRPKGENIKTENQNSLIVACQYKKHNILFMGDGDINSFNTLPDYIKNHITIMKSGHHGAENTISEEMAKNTDLFIISTGKNVYNHPHPETLKILDKYKKLYYRTDYHNAIKVKFNKDKVQILLYSPIKNKFEKIKM